MRKSDASTINQAANPLLLNRSRNSKFQSEKSPLHINPQRSSIFASPLSNLISTKNNFSKVFPHLTSSQFMLNSKNTQKDSFYTKLDKKDCTPKIPTKSKKKKRFLGINTTNSAFQLKNENLKVVNSGFEISGSSKDNELMKVECPCSFILKNQVSFRTTQINEGASDFKIPSHLSSIQLTPRKYESGNQNLKKRIKVKQNLNSLELLKRKNNYCFTKSEIMPPKTIDGSEADKNNNNVEKLVKMNEYMTGSAQLSTFKKVAQKLSDSGSVKNRMKLWLCLY